MVKLSFIVIWEPSQKSPVILRLLTLRRFERRCCKYTHHKQGDYDHDHVWLLTHVLLRRSF